LAIAGEDEAKKRGGGRQQLLCGPNTLQPLGYNCSIVPVGATSFCQMPHIARG
jgi:hypothetical protein